MVSRVVIKRSARRRCARHKVAAIDVSLIAQVGSIHNGKVMVAAELSIVGRSVNLTPEASCQSSS